MLCVWCVIRTRARLPIDEFSPTPRPAMSHIFKRLLVTFIGRTRPEDIRAIAGERWWSSIEKSVEACAAKVSHKFLRRCVSLSHKLFCLGCSHRVGISQVSPHSQLGTLVLVNINVTPRGSEPHLFHNDKDDPNPVLSVHLMDASGRRVSTMHVHQDGTWSIK